MTKSLNKEYDFLAFIGRFQPFHIGHYRVLQTALEKSNEVIVMVGSANRPRTAKNPLTFEERKNLIQTLLTTDEMARVHVVPINDYMYNDVKWEAEIQATIFSTSHYKWKAGPTKIGIIGHSKDHTSYYLKKFPQYDLLDIPQDYVVNATEIREAMYCWVTERLDFTKDSWFRDSAHKGAVKWLFASDELDTPAREHYHIRNYKKSFASMPYPPVFVTTDAVVVQSGHVLLVRRGAMPGEGLWALPGGFLNQNEVIEDGMLRELVEETAIGERLPKLRGNIVRWFVADHPERSQRGRTISHAAYIKLPDGELPKIKGSDDAAHAEWIELSKLKLMQNQMFEDHYDILDQFLGL